MDFIDTADSSQPMIFCLLLVNLLCGGGKLDNLLNVEFPETNNPYHIEMDESFLSSLFTATPVQNPVEDDETCSLSFISNFTSDSAQISSFSAEFPEKGEGIQGDTQTLPILPGIGEENRHINQPDKQIRRIKLAQVEKSSLPEDVIEFIDLCERGILYDELMRRLDIPIRRRKSFKRLFYAQVFFGKVKQTGRVTQLFARDFPTVYKAICELKRKDYQRMAYLLQAHESKLMIDIIARRILAEMPGTFVGTIHDSIMTTPDKADEVRAIMMEEFRRFGLKPTIRLESYESSESVGKPALTLMGRD